jgi:hypothetical protein
MINPQQKFVVILVSKEKIEMFNFFKISLNKIEIRSLS